MKNMKNSKLQGNVGIGQAIAYFTAKGYIISIPINDSQNYDLIIDDGNKLNKVQVKTTRYLVSSSSYQVELRTRTHYHGKFYSEKGLGKDIDLVFILCENGDRYLIPRKEIKAETAITVGNKYKKYLII